MALNGARATLLAWVLKVLQRFLDSFDISPSGTLFASGTQFSLVLKTTLTTMIFLHREKIACLFRFPVWCLTGFTQPPIGPLNDDNNNSQVAINVLTLAVLASGSPVVFFTHNGTRLADRVNLVIAVYHNNNHDIRSTIITELAFVTSSLSLLSVSW
jgi:hypothetical protein